MDAVPALGAEDVQGNLSAECAARSATAAHRAVSISAKAAHAIDQEALALLIAGAREVARRCDDLLTQCQSRESGAQQAAQELQERLQLGARMLKAFQAQINQLQALFSELRNRQQGAQSAEAQIRKRLAEFDAYVEGAHKKLDDRAEQAALAAIQRIEKAAMTKIESQPSENRSGDPGDNQRQHDCEDLARLSTMLHEAALRVAHLAETGVEAETQSARGERAEAFIEAKPKATSVEAPVQPPLRLHA